MEGLNEGEILSPLEKANPSRRHWDEPGVPSRGVFGSVADTNVRGSEEARPRATQPTSSRRRRENMAELRNARLRRRKEGRTDGGAEERVEL
jgi:hypothetical protein